MKNFILITILLTIFSAGYSQNTLSFSQVKILVNGTSYTVPSNTVWKIVSVQAAANTDNGSGASASITPPSGSATTCYFDMNYGGSELVGNTLPMWLPATTVVKPTNQSEFLSVIEFTVN